MQDRKIRYKMYKAGKHWIFAAITVATLGIGAGEVRADNVSSTASDSTVLSDKIVSTENSTNAESTVIKNNSTAVSTEVGESTSAVETKQKDSSSTKENVDSSSVNKNKIDDSKEKVSSSSSQKEQVTPTVDNTERAIGVVTPGATQEHKNGNWYLKDSNGKYVSGFQEISDQNKTVYYNPKNYQMVYGQQNIDGHWYLFDNVTGALKTGIQYINDQKKLVYYDNKGQMQYGSINVNGKKYDTNRVTGAFLGNGQKNIDGKWYLFDNKGNVLTGFQTITSQNKVVYYNPQTAQMVYGQQNINGHWYLFDKVTGARLSGFQNLKAYGENKVVYYASNGQMQYGQQNVNGKWYLFDKVTGAMKTGFQDLKSYGQAKTVYYASNGQMQYGWQVIGKNVYYFNPVTGAMVKGQQNINNKWYNFGTDGARLVGLQKIPSQNKTVYYNNYGQMQYGWQWVNNATRYFDKVTGAMQYGQQNIDGHWYLFDNTGAMQRGFQYIANQNKLVYYNNDGWMLYGNQNLSGKNVTLDKVTGEVRNLKGQQNLDGSWYLFNNSGKVLTGFQNIKDQNKTVYYSPQTAKMQYGQQNINGKWYLFDKVTGAMQTGFQDITPYGQKKIVYYNNQGQMQYGWQNINNNKYYFDTVDGAMYTGSHTINQVEYSFDAQGRLLSMNVQQYRELVAQDIATNIKAKTGIVVDSDWNNQNDNYLAFTLHDVAQLVAKGQLSATNEAIQINMKNNGLFEGKTLSIWTNYYDTSDMFKAEHNAVSDYMKDFTVKNNDLKDAVLGVGSVVNGNSVKVAVVLFKLGNVDTTETQAISKVINKVSDVYSAPGVNSSAVAGLKVGDTLTEKSGVSNSVTTEILTGKKGEKISQNDLKMIFNNLAGNTQGIEGQEIIKGQDGNNYHYVYWLNDKINGNNVGKQEAFLEANKNAVYGGNIIVNYSATLTWGDPVKENTSNVSTGKPTSQMTADEIALAYKTGTDTGLRYEHVKVEPIKGMTDNMIRGVDVGSYQALVNAGVKFYDFNGNQVSIFKVLKDAGVNWIRLRIWNNPYNVDNQTYAGGDDSEYNVVKMAKEASAYGMKVLLDFHYSDFWADPAKQPLPKAWTEESGNTLAKSVYNYTRKVLLDLKNAGVNVGMVQVGNEITNGVFGIASNRDKGESYYDIWGNQSYGTLISKYLNAGSKAVRDTLPNAQIAMHIETPNIEKYRNIMNVLKKNNVDYDLLGTSYYPFWSTHDGNGWYDNVDLGYGANTPKMLEAVEKLAKNEFGKRVVVLETGWINNVNDSDGTGNSIGANSEIQAYSHDPQGQVDAMSDMYKALVAGNGLGGFWWEPAWIPVKAGWDNWQYNKDASDIYGTGWASKYAVGYAPDSVMYYNGKPTWGGSTWDNVALFDDLGYPLQSLMMYKGFLTGYETPKQVSSAVTFKVTKVWDNNVVVKNALVAGSEVKSTETLNAITDVAAKNLTGVEKNTFNQATLEDIAKGLGGISSALVGNKTYYASNGDAYHYEFWLSEGTSPEQKEWNFYNDNRNAKYGDTLVANVEATLVWGAAPTKA
ncbi:glycosyl hydrolase 53 family protein [Ligilactobacillus sp. MP3]|uniref:glycosyl hydrolase 53 family protein n=1 Tax=Ligilactobacillus sp. MP3 TaxID=2965103 RepID=UPI00210BBE19|nr:glycosyl hydrolase 53 family protein [Ligilactobacillus sp. MP3]MCQ4116535.1 glycosyl hydrolase 53 family protein [Ligilactobacillus sp. MP3]